MLASDPSQSGQYVPISGECPLCETPLLWIDLLQRKRKMQGIAEEEDDEDSDNESSGSDGEMNYEEGNESFSDCWEKFIDLLEFSTIIKCISFKLDEEKKINIKLSQFLNTIRLICTWSPDGYTKRSFPIFK